MYGMARYSREQVTSCGKRRFMPPGAGEPARRANTLAELRVRTACQNYARAIDDPNDPNQERYRPAGGTVALGGECGDRTSFAPQRARAAATSRRCPRSRAL